ncbi:cis-prenyltransferase [Saitozyma podzolica]|uniref:Alkyl transferase n=1 Tax=Saitozyma podzolica TaxID=1890683 RepID=A0A427YJ28_9TREE|nr:cis-prenyltransferase [Saitozyma podzolica]
MASSHPVLSAVLHRLHSLATTFLLYLLSLGPLPRHVGFVMDGNRRYARGRGKRVAEGHSDGFQSLRRTLEVCLKLNIRAVTIYAFAIDNFSRSPDEVEALMSLARTRLLELCQHGDLLQKYGVKLRFVGRVEMLPPEVRDAVERMEQVTAGHKRGVLNVACPYASRDEIAMAVRHTVEDVYDGRASSEDITSRRIFNNLETCRAVVSLGDLPPDPRLELEGGKLDILVRTSNVKRLSDFMMWQASEDTQLHFVRTMWPEFGLSDLLPILLGWQQKMWLRGIGC